MGIIDKFKYKFKNLSASEISKELDDPILRALFGGEEITREKAMSIPSVSSNVDLISSMIASMPIKLYKDKGTKVEEVKNDYRIALLNDETKDLLDSFQWKKALVTDYLMGKGGYSYIKWTRNIITGLYYVECDKVTAFKNTDPIYKKCDFMINTRHYKEWEILRLLRNSKDGIIGKAITTEVSKALETSFATMVYQLNLVKKGGNKKGFLTTDTKLSQEAIDSLKEAWKNMYLTNEENCVVLNKGMEFKESSNSSVEMQLDQSKNTLDKQIDKIFHIEADFNETFKKAILPIVKALESALNRYLLLEKEKKQGLFFEFDIKEITKVSLKERYEAYQIALTSGWKSRNEIRYEENDDQIEGLDTYNVSLGAVLFDPKTQTYFVPNTSQIQGIGENTSEDEENHKIPSKNDEKITELQQDDNENTQKDEEKVKGGEKDEV